MHIREEGCTTHGVYVARKFVQTELLCPAPFLRGTGRSLRAKIKHDVSDQVRYVLAIAKKSVVPESYSHSRVPDSLCNSRSMVSEREMDRFANEEVLKVT